MKRIVVNPINEFLEFLTEHGDKNDDDEDEDVMIF